MRKETSMTREKLEKELEKIRQQLRDLTRKEQELSALKEQMDLDEAKAIVEKRKIAPEDLKKLLDLKESEINEILEKRKKEYEGNQSKIY